MRAVRAARSWRRASSAPASAVVAYSAMASRPRVENGALKRAAERHVGDRLGQRAERDGGREGAQRHRGQARGVVEDAGRRAGQQPRGQDGAEAALGDPGPPVRRARAEQPADRRGAGAAGEQEREGGAERRGGEGQRDPAATPKRTPAAVAVTWPGNITQVETAANSTNSSGAAGPADCAHAASSDGVGIPTVCASTATSGDEREHRETQAGERTATERIGGQPGHQQNVTARPTAGYGTRFSLLNG